VTNPPPPQSELDFLRLVQWSSAGSLGVTAAFIESLKSVNPTVKFAFSIWTLLVFAGVASTAWFVVERVFFRALLAGRKPPVRLAAGFTAFLTLGTLAGFALGLRGVSAERQRDMAIGTLWAVLALSVVGFAFWKVVQFLERDARESEKPNPPPDE
jgi:hypothetical protein